MSFADPPSSARRAKSLDYMGLEPGPRMQEVAVQNVFIGSCTNSRIEDLRAAAAVLRGPHKAASIKRALVVPGSGLVKAQAEAEGLDRIFIEGGLRMARAGLLGVPGDEPGQSAARRALRLDLQPQFRRPPGPGRAHASVSPAMAAAAAVTGRLADVRELVAMRSRSPPSKGRAIPSAAQKSTPTSSSRPNG